MADILTLSMRPRPPKPQNLYALLLRRCIETATLSGRPLSLGLLRDILRTAPKSRQELADDEWAANSLCSRCIMQAEARYDAGEIAEADFDRILDFWTKSFAGQDAALRSSVLGLLETLAETFGQGRGEK